MTPIIKDFRYTKSELAAHRVLSECGLDDPTDHLMSQIIFGRGAFYEEVPLKGKDGEIVSVHGKSIISISSIIEYIPKKRFAAAHELGHFEMHKNIRPIFSDTEESLMDWYKGSNEEIEANEFAAEFLMPSDIFYDYIKSYRFSPKLIEAISSYFNVSKTAAILKYVKRGPHPVFVVFCKDNKMKWWRKSEDFRYFCLFDKDLPPPSGSVARELFTTNNFYSGDELEQQIYKSDWFQLKSGEEDSKFFEYCLYVRSYNYTLSVVWER